MAKDDSYSIKEFIAHSMEEMKETISEIHADVKEIKVQTQKTNGRVSKLEFWRSVIIWGFGVMMAMLIPITMIIKVQIEKAVEDVLATYNLEK